MARLTRNKQTIKQTICNFYQFLLDVQSTLTLCTHYYKHYGVKSNSYCYETFSEQRITLRAFFGTRMISFLMGLLLRMPPRKEKGEHSVFSGHSSSLFNREEECPLISGTLPKLPTLLTHKFSSQTPFQPLRRREGHYFKIILLTRVRRY